MKKKTQIERFMNYEVAIRIKDEKEFNELMDMVRKADGNIQLCWEFKPSLIIIKRYDRFSLIRHTEEESRVRMLTVEDFNQSEKQQPIPRVLINGNATIVWFDDGDKVVVKHTDDLPYDQEKAISMACAKKLLGGYSKFQELMDITEVKDGLENNSCAIIIDDSLLYSTYLNFFTGELEKYKDKYVVAQGMVYTSYEKPHNGEKVKIVDSKDGLVVIKPVNKNGLYLISSKGLKFL